MSIRFAILTVSDRSHWGERPDASGPALVEEVRANGHLVTAAGIVPDEKPLIASQLIDWADSDVADVLLTTGGTGMAPRDITPEATLQVIDRLAPGLAEAMRADSLKITPHAMLSRGVCGMRGKTLILNLPGSPKAAVENLRVTLPVLQHAVDLLREAPASEAGHTIPKT